MDSKYCFKCKQMKEVTEFNINKNKKYFNQCKRCYLNQKYPDLKEYELVNNSNNNFYI